MEEIKLNLENLSEEERKQLMVLVEKANKPKSKVWKPKKDEMYYYLNGAGDICMDEFTPKLHWDEETYNIGNMFCTREEAMEESKRRKILAQWKRLSIEAGENENPWDEDNKHWNCSYYFTYKKIQNDWHKTLKGDGIYFPTEKSLLDAIKVIGEENVKKYILGVFE